MKKIDWSLRFGIQWLVPCMIFFLSSCAESYTKVQKSTDVNYKYKKAVEYYNKKRYYQAIPIFEELIGLFKADKRAEDLYYYYANAEFLQKNYIIAGYHFRRFTEIFPESKYTEECLFKWAESYAKQSSDFDLEQENTASAIDAYQIFINAYPNSERVKDCNVKIDQLRRKLELKSLSIAQLYYKTQNYRAAALSFKQTLQEFPDIDEAAELHYMIVKSYIKFAQLSIPSKKSERFKEVIKEYEYFKGRFPESPKLTELKKYYELAKSEVIKGYYEWAGTVRLEEREFYYSETFRAWKNYGHLIEDEKTRNEMKELAEQAEFMIIRNQYVMAESSSGDTKKTRLLATIDKYQKFIDKFAGSKFKFQAEKIYIKATEQLKKQISNG